MLSLLVESNVFLLAKPHVSGLPLSFLLVLPVVFVFFFLYFSTIVTSAALSVFCFVSLLSILTLDHVCPCLNLTVDFECFRFAADQHQNRSNLDWRPATIQS